MELAISLPILTRPYMGDVRGKIALDLSLSALTQLHQSKNL